MCSGCYAYTLAGILLLNYDGANTKALYIPWMHVRKVKVVPLQYISRLVMEHPCYD